MKIAVIILFGLAALYAVGVLAIYLLQDLFIFPAVRETSLPAEAGVPEMSVVTVRTRDGLDLHGWYGAPSDPAKSTVLLFHGNGETIAWNAPIARRLLDSGFGVYLAEYRGYGGNPGKPSETGLYEDARAAMDFVEGRSARIVLHGYSLGTGVAVQLATERAVESLILQAPYTSIADIAEAQFPFLPARQLTRHRFDNIGKIAAVRAPVLIYYGTRDRTIPNAQSLRLYSAANSPKRIAAVEGAGHTDIWRSGGGDLVIDYLNDRAAAH